MKEYTHPSGISAKVVAKSYHPSLVESITTFEIVCHRWILAEINTHRMLSRNYQSSRAVPVLSNIERIRENPAMPVHWGANQAGMQAEEECRNLVRFDSKGLEYSREDFWRSTAEGICNHAEALHQAGYHKQIVNRLTEPFQMIKGVITATELANLFYLRIHKDAQPEFKILAELMYQAYEETEGNHLSPGEWHMPYYNDQGVWTQDSPDTLEEALKISATCVAQVSFRKLDQSKAKVDKIWSALVDTGEGNPVHGSPTEHQGTPMQSLKGGDPINWEEGISHMDRKGRLWSGNFRGFIQHRKLIKNEYKEEY